VTVEAEGSAGLSIVASLNGLSKAIDGWCGRMDREQAFRARANEAFRQVPFIINVPLVAGAATLNPASAGPDTGYYWSIRKLAAVSFTAGSVNTYIDNVLGEPIVPFPQAAVNTFGKGQQIIPPGSNIAVSATGITGTVQIWGRADQFETWLLPWYLGAQRDG
jgi:hypothetical protein